MGRSKDDGNGKKRRIVIIVLDLPRVYDILQLTIKGGTKMPEYITIRTKTLKKIAIADAVGWVVMISTIVYLYVR